MPRLRGDLEKALYALTMEHLAKLAEYIPGPVKKKGSRDKLLNAGYVQILLGGQMLRDFQ